MQSVKCAVMLLGMTLAVAEAQRGGRRGGGGGRGGRGGGGGGRPAPVPPPAPPTGGRGGRGGGGGGAPAPVPPTGGGGGAPAPVPPTGGGGGGGGGGAAGNLGAGIVAADRAQYQPVVQAIAGVIQSRPGTFRPLLVRLAWHTVSTFDASARPIGGSVGGCVRVNPEAGLADNRGLDVATRALEAVKTAHPFVSYADLYLLAGNTALEMMGSPTLFFRAGRRDFVAPAETNQQCVDDNERLPTKRFNNDNFPHPETLDYIFDKFGELGISLNTDRQALEKIVALFGGHNMGETHLAVSGNQGRWTTDNLVFGTEYFFNLDNGPWGRNTAETRGTDLQYRGGPGRRSVMLPIDMALRADNRLRNIVRQFSRDRAAYETHFVAAWRQIQENGFQ